MPPPTPKPQLSSLRLAFSALAALPLASCSRPADAASAERGQVAATVQRYFEAHATGMGEHIEQAFHPQARIQSVKDGKLASLTRDEFTARFSGKPADDEAKRKRRIASIDIAGDAALAKVELDYPDVRFVDYLSLLKLDGKWVVVNKIFHADRRAAK
jgi:Putative lumazine-binding